jgi:hypothetical protein
MKRRLNQQMTLFMNTTPLFMNTTPLFMNTTPLFEDKPPPTHLQTFHPNHGDCREHDDPPSSSHDRCPQAAERFGAHHVR